jgi:hypothetical protein
MKPRHFPAARPGRLNPTDDAVSGLSRRYNLHDALSARLLFQRLDRLRYRPEPESRLPQRDEMFEREAAFKAFAAKRRG